ncbi:hypothetical protein BD779DRAFT_1507469 [Infundibulicybe gibba]|nr:hypothetical protein BD779DRAFT_1507469 [Infundibulicybe gibba]
MTRVENVKKNTGAATARGRGTYSAQACNVCRIKKSKCDGVRPVCESCSIGGRQSECSWGREPARKPRTEAHFESLRKRIDALEEYVVLLESMLDKCRLEHNGVDAQAWLQFKPLDVESAAVDDVQLGPEHDDDDMEPELGGAIAQELCVGSTHDLTYEKGIFISHGNTAPFRFVSQSGTLALPPASRFPAITEHPEATYTLLVDGVGDTPFNPDFDWSRHLPSVVPLDRRTHDKLLDLLFKFFTSWCLRIIPAFSCETCIPLQTAHYSPMLHNALLALATAFSDDLRIRDLKARQYFAVAAKNLIESECQKPNLSVVHALSILGSFHSSQGDQTLGYLYFGMSARMSQALGLNIECSPWVRSGLINEYDMLDRYWAYWTTFTQDVCWSLYVGRDFYSHLDELPWHYLPAGIPPQPNLLSKTFAATCELLRIARRIMDVVYGFCLNLNRSINDVDSDWASLELNTWKGQLSPDIDITIKSRPTATPHLLMTHLAYWWLFILLHRPFYHRRPRPIHSSDKDIDHAKLCKRAAENIMELLGTWRTLYTLRYVPITLIQTIFSAGTIYLLTAVHATTGLRVFETSLEHSLSQANLCIQYLLETGKSWQCATNIAGILRNLLQEQRGSARLIPQLAEPTAASPSTSSGRGASRRRRGRSASTKSIDRTRTRGSTPASTAQANPVSVPISPLLMTSLSLSSPSLTALPSPPSNPTLSATPPVPPIPIEQTPQLNPFDSLFDDPNIFSMDSTRLLAMLGGQTFPDTPFVASFSANNINGNIEMDHTYASTRDEEMHGLDADGGILDEELRDIWERYFGNI